jgi:hypothetical protein
MKNQNTKHPNTTLYIKLLFCFSLFTLISGYLRFRFRETYRTFLKNGFKIDMLQTNRGSLGLVIEKELEGCVETMDKKARHVGSQPQILMLLFSETSLI